MPEVPRVTVAIAAYCAEPFLAAAIRSALAQEGVALDVVIADDASPDGTSRLVEHMATCDPRLALVRCPVNEGPAGARNRAFAHARGDWIAVLDSDDGFAPGRLARMCRMAEAHGADIVLDDFVSIAPGGAILEAPRLSSRRGPGFLGLADWLDLNGLRRGEISFGYAKPLVSRGFLQRSGLEYQPELRNGEDFHLILEALAQGARVYFTGESGYLYTRREGSVSRRSNPAHMLALARADAAVQARLPSELRRAADPLFARRRRNILRLATTETVLGELKAGHPGRAAAGLARHPAALGRVLGHVGEALRKRLVPAR